MSKVIFHCDGCGKQEEGGFSNDAWHKPERWFQRSDDDGPQIACSRECIDKISAKSSKTGVVLPV